MTSEKYIHNYTLHALIIGSNRAVVNCYFVLWNNKSHPFGKLSSSRFVVTDNTNKAVIIPLVSKPMLLLLYQK